MIFSTWIKSPEKIGAIAPSGKRLSMSIAEYIKEDDIVLELGSGTGAVTRYLREKTINLYAIEQDPQLYKELVVRLPEITAVEGCATRLHEISNKNRIPAKYDVIISCLPLLSIPQDIVRQIIRQKTKHLKEDGKIIQFTYGPTCPISSELLEENNLVAYKGKRVIANIPPARIWEIRKKNVTI